MRKTNLVPKTMQSHEVEGKRRLALSSPARLIAFAILLLILVAGCGAKAEEFPLGDFNNGRFIMTVMAEGKYTVVDGSNEYIPIENGRYTVNGSEVTFVDESCGVDEGKYTWSFDGEKLRMESNGDPCDSRREQFARAWSFLP